jgi:hypothetical protein
VILIAVTCLATKEPTDFESEATHINIQQRLGIARKTKVSLLIHRAPGQRRLIMLAVVEEIMSATIESPVLGLHKLKRDFDLAGDSDASPTIHIFDLCFIFPL